MLERDGSPTAAQQGPFVRATSHQRPSDVPCNTPDPGAPEPQPVILQQATHRQEAQLLAQVGAPREAAVGGGGQGGGHKSQACKREGAGRERRERVSLLCSAALRLVPHAAGQAGSCASTTVSLQPAHINLHSRSQSDLPHLPLAAAAAAPAPCTPTLQQSGPQLSRGSHPAHPAGLRVAVGSGRGQHWLVQRVAMGCIESL